MGNCMEVAEVEQGYSTTAAVVAEPLSFDTSESIVLPSFSIDWVSVNIEGEKPLCGAFSPFLH